MTLTQLASHFGVTKQAVDQWARRRAYNGFPLPECRGAYERASGYGCITTNLYSVEAVQRWRTEYRPVYGRKSPTARNHLGQFVG